MIADPIVDWGAVLDVVWASLLGGVGFAVSFSLLLVGATRAVVDGDHVDLVAPHQPVHDPVGRVDDLPEVRALDLGHGATRLRELGQALGRADESRDDDGCVVRESCAMKSRYVQFTSTGSRSAPLSSR